MYGNTLAMLRNHLTADAVSIKNFGDCYRVDIRWNDGAWVYVIYDTKDEALAHVHSLGWA